MQIPRQLYNEGGISSVPLRRENFGLGSSFKKFVRKVIPKEIAQVAVKAAPFVAPFNPAVAGAMSGLGTFQQTGRMGQSLTAGGLNYAGGQAARYLGGAGFQGNPFTSGAFTPSGFMGGFSSPLGTETGLGKFLSDRRLTRQGINIDKGRGSTLGQTYRQPGQPGINIDKGRGSALGNMYRSPTPLVDAADAGTIFPHQGNMADANVGFQPVRPYQDRVMRIASGAEPRPDLRAVEKVLQGGGADVMPADTFTKAATEGIAGTSQKVTGGSTVMEKIKSLNPLSKDFDFTKAGDTVKDIGGKALKAVFTKPDGQGGTTLDKTAILAALITVPTYLEARGIANEAGLSEEEFTEDMFNAAKSDSKQTYESNLGSFFEGTGYTGNLAKGGLIRKNYAFGADPDEFPETDSDITIFELIKDQGVPIGEQTKGKIKQGAKSILMAEGTGLSPEQEAMIDGMLQKGADTDTISSITGASPDQIKIYLQTQKKKLSKGGRIGFDRGGNEAINFIHRNKISKAIEDAEKMGFDIGEIYENAPEYGGEGDLHSLTQIFKNEKIRKALINEGHDPDKIMREFLVEQMKSQTGDLPSDSRGYSEFFRKGGRVNFGEGTKNPYEYGTVDYFKWWLDEGATADTEAEYMGGFGFANEMDLIKKLEEAGGDATVYKDNLQKKINENAEWFQSLSPKRQKEEKDYLNETFKKDYDKGIMPGQGEWWGKDVVGDRIRKGKSNPYEPFYKEAKHGGIMRKGYALGTTMPLPSEAGLGGLPVEADMRYTGGFMPYGEKEKADDVPARLSKNEFVFTADAVRAAGGGSMQKGAQRMYNTMKMLEGQLG